MRHDPTFWLMARAFGLTAYVMLTLSVLVGLVLRARPFRSLKPAAVTDLHRTLALLALGSLVGHAVALVLDTTVRVSIPALFVPGLISYRPVWTSVGVLTAELMVIVYASFSQRKRIGAKNWRRCTGRPTGSSPALRRTGSRRAPTRHARGPSRCTSPPSPPSRPQPPGGCSFLLPRPDARHGVSSRAEGRRRERSTEGLAGSGSPPAPPSSLRSRSSGSSRTSGCFGSPRTRPTRSGSCGRGSLSFLVRRRPR